LTKWIGSKAKTKNSTILWQQRQKSGSCAVSLQYMKKTKEDEKQ